MDDMTIKNRITDAMQEPSVPEGLVERTAELARAVRAGREAEKRLAQADKTLPREEKEQLAAQSLVGRLMRNSLPPEGVSAEKLTKELRGRETFGRAMEKPTDVLLAELKNGKLIRSIAAAERMGMERKPPEKTLSEKRMAEKKTPERKGPDM